jgi:hypothetical protein
MTLPGVGMGCPAECSSAALLLLVPVVVLVLENLNKIEDENERRNFVHLSRDDAP